MSAAECNAVFWDRHRCLSRDPRFSSLSAFTGECTPSGRLGRQLCPFQFKYRPPPLLQPLSPLAQTPSGPPLRRHWDPVHTESCAKGARRNSECTGQRRTGSERRTGGMHGDQDGLRWRRMMEVGGMCNLTGRYLRRYGGPLQSFWPIFAIPG